MDLNMEPDKKSTLEQLIANPALTQQLASTIANLQKQQQRNSFLISDILQNNQSKSISLPRVASGESDDSGLLRQTPSTSPKSEPKQSTPIPIVQSKSTISSAINNPLTQYQAVLNQQRSVQMQQELTRIALQQRVQALSNPLAATSLGLQNHFLGGINAQFNLMNQAAFGFGKKCRRSRTVFSEEQLNALETAFQEKKYLSTPDRIELAEKLRLTQVQVKTWYQNRRMKWKKQCRPGEEGDSDSNKLEGGITKISNGDESEEIDF